MIKDLAFYDMIAAVGAGKKMSDTISILIVSVMLENDIQLVFKGGISFCK